MKWVNVVGCLLGCSLSAMADPTAVLTITADAADVAVRIKSETDSEGLTATPGEPVVLSAGRYTVTGESPSDVKRKESIELYAGQYAEVVLLFDIPDAHDGYAQWRHQTELQLTAPENWEDLQQYPLTETGETLVDLLPNNALDERYLTDLRLLADDPRMNATEVRYWLSVLPIMTKEQRGELQDIQTTGHVRRQMQQSGESREAFSLHYHEALVRYAPRSAWAQLRLAREQYCAGLFLTAERSWQQSLAINEEDMTVRNSFAWALATTGDDRYRDGETAMKLLEGRVDNNTPAEIQDTYAATFAAQGDFTQAIHWQQQALVTATGAGMRKAFQQRLQLYQSNEVYTEKPVCR